MFLFAFLEKNIEVLGHSGPYIHFLFHSLFVQSDFMKTHNSFISERELKHVIYLISDYCSWFVCCSGNIILVERSPGRCNSLFFALLVIFDYCGADKRDSGNKYFNAIFWITFTLVLLYFFTHLGMFTLVLWMQIFVNITPIGYRYFEITIWCLERKYCAFTITIIVRGANILCTNFWKEM